MNISRYVLSEDIVRRYAVCNMPALECVNSYLSFPILPHTVTVQWELKDDGIYLTWAVVEGCRVLKSGDTGRNSFTMKYWAGDPRQPEWFREWLRSVAPGTDR